MSVIARARANNAVAAQVAHLNAKHGERSAQHAMPGLWTQIAAEEFGEIARAQLEQDTAHEYTELAQLAACCLARMIGIDMRGER